MGCPFTRERKQKKNPIFIFKSVRVRLRESVLLWECGNTECHWEVKRGFEKASISRAVHLRVSVSRELTVFIFESNLDRSSRHSRLLEMNMSFFKQRLLSKQV